MSQSSSTQSAPDWESVIRLLSLAVQQGAQAGASSSRGPSLRDLPKDAFRLPTIKGELTGPGRCRPAHVATFLSRLDQYLNVYQSVLPTESLRLDAITGCFPDIRVLLGDTVTNVVLSAVLPISTLFSLSILGVPLLMSELAAVACLAFVRGHLILLPNITLHCAI
jgi:hypothetical protein